MFVTFQKITTSNPSKKSTILVNTESILYMDVDSFEDKSYGGMYDATRIEVPNYKFFTATPMADILSIIPSVDFTSGVATTGSQCAGTPGALNIILPKIDWPLIKAPMVFNNSPTETREYVFNPSFIVYVEPVMYNGPGGRQYPALMVVLRDNQPRQVLSKLDMADIISLLEPTEIL